MAFEHRVATIPGAQAAADYKTTSKQFYCMKKNTTDLRYAICDTDGEIFDGVLQDTPDAAGVACEIMYLGISKLEAGETLTAGDFWGTDSSAKAKIVESSNTGADTGDFVMGRIIVGAASGALAVGSVGVPSFKVESV